MSNRLACVGLVLALANCAARRPQLRPPELVTTVQQMAQTDRMAAIAYVESAIAADPKSADRPWAMVQAGEQRRLAGDTAMSRRWFEQAATEYPGHPLNEVARLGMAVIDAETSLSGNTLAMLQLGGDRGVPDTLNADRYRILALVAQREGSATGKTRDLVRKAVAYAASDSAVEARVRASLLSDDRSTPVEVAVSAPPVSEEQRAVERARQALARGEHAAVITDGQRFAELWPESEYAREMSYMVLRAEAGDPSHPGRVGVLLPRSGPYGPVGEQLKQVIELANDRLGGQLDLIWFDTGSEEVDVVAGAEALVLEHGCMALLGPILKDHVMPAAETAQAMGVTMLALSQSQDPTAAGPYVYRGFLPLGVQVEALLEHAMTTLGLQRFAVLYPDSSYGQTTRDLFATGVEKRGGMVVRVESYDPAATDFLQPAQRLGQKDYEARKAEFWKLKRDAIKADPKADTSKMMLPPIIDFEAIFLPDSWRRVALVASSLAYEEFPVGDFQPYRDAEPVALFGLNGWNDARIVEAGGTYVQDATFVDTFLVSSSREPVQRFVADYQTAFGRPPGVIDALTWDAVHLLSGAVIAGGTDRDAVRAELSMSRLDPPVAGGKGFGEDREVDRDLLVLTIDGEAITPWLPPEEPEPEP